MITAQDNIEIRQASAELAAAHEDLRGFVQTLACPECQPDRFDGRFDGVPVAQFCRRHQGSAVARVYRLFGKQKKLA